MKNESEKMNQTNEPTSRAKVSHEFGSEFVDTTLCTLSELCVCVCARPRVRVCVRVCACVFA